MKQDVLYVNMLGKFTLTYAGRQISCDSNRSKLLWNLLAYLLCHRKEFVSTEKLISVLWKQEKNDNPAGAMRTAIYRARSMLSELTEDASFQFLIAKNGGYSWNPDLEIVVDIEEFDKLVRSAIEDENGVAAGLNALKLYEGKFLPVQSSEMWVMPVQAYYHNLYESLFERVVPSLEQEARYEEGIAICNKGLRIDPYSEKTYQHLMRFLLNVGEQQEVVRVYEEMSKLLLSTFGIMPDQESKALYQKALDSARDMNIVSPETAQEQLCEHNEITGALVCDYDFFKKLYQAQARTIVRSGQVIHTALLTLKSRSGREISGKSLSVAMDNLEKHLSQSLRKGDVVTRCSSSQFMIMLPSANYENSCKVCQRCVAVFERKHPHSPVYVDFYVQPLIPSTRS